MAEIIWTEPALDDLDEIAEYIALDNLQAAQKLVKNLFATVDRLAIFPESGRYPPELDTPARYREIISGPCRVFYRVADDTVYIVYVMRSERLLRTYLLDERSER